MHHCLPVAAYGQHRSPGFFERFTVRSDAFERRVASLRNSLSKIDRCSEEFNQKVSRIIANIQEFKTATTRKLGNLKAELSSRLDRASQLVGESLYADSDPSEDPIAQALRSGQEAEEELSLFSYQLNDSRVREVVEQILLYEVKIAGETMGEELLPGIVGNTLSLYSGKGEVAKQIELAFAFKRGTRVVCANREVYFLECNGGRMFSMNIERMELIQLPSKAQTCNNFGVHIETKAIYVFGGEEVVEDYSSTGCNYSYTVMSKYSANFNMQTQVWKKLPDMADGRSNFVPAKYNNSLYLTSANSSLEAFNLTTETFQKIAALRSSYEGPSICFIGYGELIILALTPRIQYRLNLANEETEFRMLPCTSEDTHYSGASGSVLLSKGLAFWVTSEYGTLWEFSLQGNSMRDVQERQATPRSQGRGRGWRRK